MNSVHLCVPGKLRRFFPLYLLIVLGSIGAAAQSTAVKRIDSLLTALARQEDGFNGNVLVAQNDKILYQRSFGYANQASKTPLSAGSIFPIASVTKTVTAVAVMQLVGQGKLSLADPINRFFADCPYTDVTVKELLSHTSGIDDYYHPKVWQQIAGQSPDMKTLQGIFFSANLPLRFAPRTGFFYSNMNFVLLARIIEIVTKRSYEDYIVQHVFRKANMRSAYVYKSSIPAQKAPAAVTLYDYTDYLSSVVPVDSVPFDRLFYDTKQNIGGHGGICLTTTDLFRFSQALRNGTVLSRALQKQLYTPTLLSNGKSYSASGAAFPAAYGLGWIINGDSSHGVLVYHDGGTPGLKTEFFRNLSTGYCVIVFSNKEYFTSQLARSLLSLLQGGPIQLRKRSLARFAGQTYTKRGRDAAVKVLDSLQSDSAFAVRMDEVNTLGYNLLQKGDAAAAIAVFAFNTERFPADGNAWDSLGEAYNTAGKTKEAIAAYEKSVAFDPSNESGKKILQGLKAKQ